MTGFIRGLFGGNRRPRAPKPPKENGAFFLSEDEAKTFGDIDYMRSNKVVRRTFARKKGVSEAMEAVRQISSLQKQNVNQYGGSDQAKQASTPTFESARTPEAPRFQPRKADDNMDMFRNMAREIKKK